MLGFTWFWENPPHPRIQGEHRTSAQRFLGGQVPEGGPIVGTRQTFSGVSFLLCLSTDACSPARLAGLPRGKAAAEGREGPPFLGGISAPLDPAAPEVSSPPGGGGGISSLIEAV